MAKTKKAAAAKKAAPASTKADAKTDPKVLAKLEPIAHEINVRFEKASKLDGQADDHRLAAALKLAEAKKLCETNKIKFSEWAEKHVKEQAYETIRKLAAVGSASNPKKALEDLRNKNAAANRKHRESRKEQQRAAPAAETREEASEELPQIPAPLSGVEAVKAAFDLLLASEKMAFLEYAAEQVGAKIDVGFDAKHPFVAAAAAESGEEIPEIPPALRRKRAAA